MNISRILLGLLLILGAGGALAGGTSAFFSDTETSVGNFFTAGSIDLLVDNDSYYNGNHCVNVGNDVFLWQGSALFPEPGTPCSTSWGLADLNNGVTTLHKFFDFTDIKPDDEGEDTISLHVQNDAWACMDVTLTSNDDVSCTDPENAADAENGQCAEPDTDVWDGDLAQALQMFWWADDGDNVYEDGETSISGGIKTLFSLATTSPFSVALADSGGSIWTPPGPIPANQTRYIGKAWCFGTLALAPVAGNGGVNPSVDPGLSCDGVGLGNEAQTDSAKLDVAFSAVQARNNPDFLCNPPGNATLTLQKTVVNGSDGGAVDGDWTLAASGPTNISGTEGSPAVTGASVIEGNYTLSESGGIPGYGASQYSCVINGGAAVLGNNIVLAEGDVAVCTITNSIQACTGTQKWADTVLSFDQGRQRNGAPIAAARSNPATALGVANSTGAATDSGIPVGTFVSLGFATTTPSVLTASLALGFTNNVILNGPGNDVRIYEITNGTYPDEHAMVEASQDGVNWVMLTADSIRDITTDLNLGPLPWAKFIRVTDKTSPAAFTTTDPAIADAYDVDAVEAIHCAQLP